MKRSLRDLGVALTLTAIGSVIVVQALSEPDTEGRAEDTPVAEAPVSPTPATGLPDPASRTPPPPPVRRPSGPPSVPPGASKLLKRIRKGNTFRACAPTRSLGPLRVASFNIHGGVSRGGRYDLTGVANDIAAWNADVVLVQEIHRFRRGSGLADMPADLAARLGMDVAFGANFSRAPEARGAPRRESGTAVLSRFPIAESVNTLLPNLPGFQQRGLLRARLELKGQPVDLYATHLDHQSRAARLAQAQTIAATLAASDVPAVVGGDFNAAPGSPPIRAMSRAAADLWPLSGDGPGLTAPERRPRVRIDYLFSRGRWDASASYVAGSRVSDHRAVLTDLTLEVPNDCG